MKKIFIDCTPTWSAVAVACMAILRNPNATHDDINYARGEIQRMGKIVDHYVELEKKKSEVK
jgi:hypothetical protein